MTIQKWDYDIRELSDVAKNLQIPGEVYQGNHYGTGLINGTFVVETEHQCEMERFVLQRLNTNVFENPVLVMNNTRKVIAKQKESISKGIGKPLENCLDMLTTKSGVNYWVSPRGDYWKGFRLEEKARTYDFIANLPNRLHLAYEAARAFGNFARQLEGLEDIGEVLPNFHNTVWRYEQFSESLRNNYHERAEECGEEIDFVREREWMAPIFIRAMKEGTLPKRIIHNDTKINNVMFDYSKSPRTARVVIDLDTVMPGTLLYDFGDLVRSATCPTAEDEQDLSKVIFDMEVFKKLAEGYLDATRGFITQEEISQMFFSGRKMAFMLGNRFLTDHLNGDKYFHVDRDNHNLDRARTQFELVRGMEKREEEMKGIILDLVA